MARAVGLYGITQVWLAYLECERFITVLFGFFVALAINVKQKAPSALKRKVYPLLGSALDQ